MNKGLKKCNGITLVGLVVTIILLLILAGITISTLGGENGILSKTIQAKNAHIGEKIKEQLVLALQELQLEKQGKATLDDVTQQWIDEKLSQYKNKVIDDASTNGKKVTIRKDDVIKKFLIDEKLNIIDIISEGSIDFSYIVKDRVDNKVNILIYVQDIENGLKEIQFVDDDIIYLNGTKEEKAIDYEIELEKEYKIIIKAEDGSEKEVIIIEYNIAKPIIKADTEWTNKDLEVEVDFGNINKNVKKLISIDGGITYNAYIGPVKVSQNTIVKARAVGIGIQEESQLEIKNIDKIEPKQFTPIISDLVSSTELTINANAIDAESTNEYGNSGIKQYQYYVCEGEILIDSSQLISSGSWIASGLTVGKMYKIYVDVYDNAGNKRESEIISYEKLDVYSWNKFNTTNTYYEENLGRTTLKMNEYNEYTKFGSFNSSTGVYSRTGKGTCSGTSFGGKNWPTTGDRIVKGNVSGSTTNVYSIISIQNKVYHEGTTTRFNYVSYIVEQYRAAIKYDKNGDSIGIVVSNNINDYPEDGEVDGLWYELNKK